MLIAQSRLIAAQVEAPITSAAEFPAYPRILSELCGSGWLACGRAAVAFDPLCEEGVANAVREAILASAVIRAAVQDSDVESLLAHYNSRLCGRSSLTEPTATPAAMLPVLPIGPRHECLVSGHDLSWCRT